MNCQGSSEEMLLFRRSGLVWSTHLVAAFAMFAVPSVVSACSAPPVDGPELTYEAVAVGVSSQSPSVWTFRVDNGLEHQLSVMQPPGGDEAASYISQAPPIVGNRYEVTERRLRSGEVELPGRTPWIMPPTGNSVPY